MNKTEKGRYKNWKKTFCLDLTNESVVDNIVEINYSSLLPKTKEYVKSLIKSQGRNLDVTGLKSIILKEDFINEYNKSREDYPFKPDYDFSLLPNIIRNKLEKVVVVCRNTICGIEIGEFETSFSNLIDHRRDVFRIRALEKDVNPSLKENPEKTKKFKETVVKLYGPDRFDLSNVRIIESYDIFPVKIFCNTCKRFFWVQPYYFLKGNGCERCNLEQKAKDAQRVTFEVWKERAIEIHGSKYDYTLAEKEFVNQYSSVHIKCNICGTIFEQVPFGHVIKEDTRCPCPECRKIQVSAALSKEGKSTWERVVEVCGPDYDFSEVSKGIGRRDIVKYKKISTGEIIENCVDNILKGHIDPMDVRSSGELMTREWLTNHSIEFKNNKTIKGIQGRILNYVVVDFILEQLNIIIEINGEQHYYEKNFKALSRNDRYTFEQQLTRDKNVKQYCLDNNITFIEIPYTYFTYKKIDDILTRIILNNESPDFIEIPEIKYC